MVDKTSYYSYFLAITVRFIKESPHQNVFKLTLSQKSFYVFRKDRQCKFIFLLSPSLDLMNIISVRALEGMKVTGKPCREAGILCQLLAFIYNSENDATFTQFIYFSLLLHYLYLNYHFLSSYYIQFASFCREIIGCV